MRLIPKLATAVCILLAPVAAAQQVTLTSVGDDLSVTGQLLSFENGVYTISTVLGELNFDQSLVNCTGSACPYVRSSSSAIRVASSPSFSDQLINNLLNNFHANDERQAVDEQVQDGQFAADFMSADNKKQSYFISRETSSAGIEAFLAGQSDIAFTTRELRRSEASKLERVKPSLFASAKTQRIFALDGMTFVVARDNPVQSITQDDIAKVFSGEITNWSQLGGFDAPISLYARPRDSGLGLAFETIVMRPVRARLARNTILVESDSEVSAAVAQDRNGIGVTSFSSSGNVKPLAIRGQCGVQTPANQFTIKTEEYPYTRRLYVYSTAAENREVETFTDYAVSQQVQNMIAEAGFVNQSVSTRSIDAQGLRLVSAMLPTDAETSISDLHKMTSELNAADRLSITFRFAQSSAQLDERGLSDIVRLGKLISDGAFDEKEIVLVGFTDSVGSGNQNQVLSLRRAQQVRNSLLSNISDSSNNSANIVAVGFGEISPLGCNETFNGRGINRRVEVWVRDAN